MADIDDTLRIATDAIYVILFGKDTTQLRQHFGITHDNEDDDAVRDRMGILALEALIEIEHDLTDWFSRNTGLPQIEIIMAITKRHAKHFKERAQAQGVDLLTGKRL